MKINDYLNVLLLSVVVFLTGCATRAYVREYVEDKFAPFDNRVGKLETKTSELEKEASAQRDKVEGMEKRLSHLADDVKVIAVDARAAKDRAEAVLKKVEGLKIAKKVILKDSDVKFNFNKWQLTEAQEKMLEKLAHELKDKPYSIIVIAGHTDNVGSEKYNLALGRSRAEATASYLATKAGIDRNKIIVLTFGESLPAAPNNTKEGREQNRRVEITVYTDTLE